jgi:hypothetical protein
LKSQTGKALGGIFLLHIGLSIEKQAVSGSLKHVNVMENKMLDDKEKSLIMLLELPHRISNPMAMMQACTDAAALIKRLDAELDAKTESTPKRARNTDGTLKADDPDTPENEAWVGGKAPKKKAKKKN